MIKLKDIVTEIYRDAFPFLTIPDYDQEGDRYPGDIKPGSYNIEQLTQMILQNKNNPDALLFLADMLETGFSHLDNDRDALVRVLRNPKERKKFLFQLTLNKLTKANSEN